MSNLTYYIPKVNDLSFRQELLADELTMSYNKKWGGTINFPKDKWESWYNRFLKNPNNFYAYICINDTYVGEISYHKEDDIYLCDVIIMAKYRNNGYGSKAINLLCDIAKENNIKVIYDHIAVDNPSINMFLKAGFEVVETTIDYVAVRKEFV